MTPWCCGVRLLVFLRALMHVCMNMSSYWVTCSLLLHAGSTSNIASSQTPRHSQHFTELMHICSCALSQMAPRTKTDKIGAPNTSDCLVAACAADSGGVSLTHGHKQTLRLQPAVATNTKHAQTVPKHARGLPTGYGGTKAAKAHVAASLC